MNNKNIKRTIPNKLIQLALSTPVEVFILIIKAAIMSATTLLKEHNFCQTYIRWNFFVCVFSSVWSLSKAYHLVTKNMHVAIFHFQWDESQGTAKEQQCPRRQEKLLSKSFSCMSEQSHCPWVVVNSSSTYICLILLNQLSEFESFCVLKKSLLKELGYNQFH